jgi:excisionase family DNA binding protein
MNRPIVVLPLGLRPRAPRRGSNGPKPNKGVSVAEELLTVPQVAQNWQISERTVRRMIADGRLAIVRLGRSVRIPAKAAAPWTGVKLSS